jgi:guanyl-specific ribonuclease Sa
VEPVLLVVHATTVASRATTLVTAHSSLPAAVRGPAEVAAVSMSSVTSAVRPDISLATALLPEMMDIAVAAVEAALEAAVVASAVAAAQAAEAAISSATLAAVSVTFPVTALPVRSATTVSFAKIQALWPWIDAHSVGGNFGHVSRNCPEEPSNDRICYKCKQPGHLQAACPNA